jgi:outer membrane protein, heavy metal efflux system
MFSRLSLDGSDQNELSQRQFRQAREYDDDSQCADVSIAPIGTVARRVAWSRSTVSLMRGIVLMMRARLSMIAPILIIQAALAAGDDDVSPARPDNQQGRREPAAASNLGGIRRSVLSRKVEVGSRAGTETGKSRATLISPAPSSAVTARPRENSRANQTSGQRVAIPPPRTARVSQPKTAGMPSSDATIRRAAIQPGRSAVTANPLPGDMASAVQPAPARNDTMVGGQPIAMQAALYGAITSNPDLVTMREGNAIAASAEAVEVARNFPTTLNPTLWIDYRPITLVPNGTFGTGPGSHASAGGNNFYHFGQDYIYVSLRQPIELGHQTRHRYHIAQAAFDQQKWIVLQAELTAIVQTYRFFQTAAYRREKFRLAEDLADFNDRLQETLKRRMEANQVQAADVALGRVESRATRQQVKVARQDYLTALTDLRNQIGIPEQAGAFEPLGEFNIPATIPPIDEQVMIEEAIHQRPDVQAARAQIAGTDAAVKLAKGDRIPTPIVGPEYQMDEAGVQYVGFVFITPIPVWNNGKPLVLQREAEHRRAIVAYQEAQQKAVAQVRAAVAKWNGATELVNDSADLSRDLSVEVDKMERLFEEGQADMTKLMQARQRLIQLENSRLDAVWQATQAQADLLLALGIPSLINGMLDRAQQDAKPGGRAAAAPSVGPGMTADPKQTTPRGPTTGGR